MRLLLLRHAKSIRSRPGGVDFDRGLTERGEAAAALIGKFIAANDLTPARVLCSGSRRTRDTLALAAAQWSPPPDIRFDDSLYDASAGRLIEIVREHGGKASPLLLVGHNPSIQELGLALATSGPKDLVRQMRVKVPTAALAFFEAEIEAWADLGPRRCRLCGFVRPADLAGAGGS